MHTNISPMKLDDIYITHLHGDHILGLPGIIQSLAFRGRTRDLNIYGPEGIEELIENMYNLGYYTIDYNIITHVVEDNEIIYEQDDFLIRSGKMKHTVLDYAYMIEELRDPKFLKDEAIKLGVPPGPLFGELQSGNPVEVDGKTILPKQVLGSPRKGKKVVFSGDTVPIESMINFAKDADLLIHEATFDSEHRDKAYENGHTVAADAAFIAREANVGQLILTHLSNRYTDSTQLEKEAREVFENTVYAKDFMKVVLENKKPIKIK